MLSSTLIDDLAYVTKDQAETSVLFELISARYENRSILITANQPFGEWNKIFPDPAMTLAAVDLRAQRRQLPAAFRLEQKARTGASAHQGHPKNHQVRLDQRLLTLNRRLA